MNHLSTILFIALVIAINQGDGATANDADDQADQVAEETKTKNFAVTIIEGPKYVAQPNHTSSQAPPVIKQPTDQRPPSKPPIQTSSETPKPELQKIQYTDVPRVYYPVVQKIPPRHYQPHQGKPMNAPPPPHHPHHQQPNPNQPNHPRQQNQNHLNPRQQNQNYPNPNQQNQNYPNPNHQNQNYPNPNQQNQNHPNPNHPNSNAPNPNGYTYQKVIPLKHRSPYYHPKFPRQQLIFAASTGKPYIITAKSPKFSIPVQTINGIKAEFVRPPKINRPDNTTTTTTSSTTQRPLRNKRIWPKHILEKMNITTSNDTTTSTPANKTLNFGDVTKTNDTEYVPESSHVRTRYVNRPNTTTTEGPSTTRGYRRVTRVPKHKLTSAAPVTSNSTFPVNDWVPIVPSHFANVNLNRLAPKNRRSDHFPMFNNRSAAQDRQDRRMMYLQSFGLVPLNKMPINSNSARKMVFFRKRRQLNPYVYSGSSQRRPYLVEELHSEGSHPKTVVTKIKHHHHHHHHKYIKTVEKKVPYKVEVPKPYPVPFEKKVPVPVPVPYEKIVEKIVEKKVPYPVAVPFEKKVPYPVQVKVPHPVPYKVVEKEYVPKPYPIIHHVPVVKHVEVKVPHPVPYNVEKKVPVPVEVKVPVDRPYPVQVEKRVPYPVPVKVFVPQPYAVETKVPYPVQVKVKEPVEVVKHVPVRVPVPQPFAVKYPVPVPVEKRVPYPVEVEKKVPVPFKVYVPQRVEVEKKVPVYVPKPYPVETKVPVPYKVPYPVRVPVKVPVKVPVEVPVGVPVYLEYNTGGINFDSLVESGLQASGSADDSVTENPDHTVTVHGNTGFTGFSARNDGDSEGSTTANPGSTESTD